MIHAIFRSPKYLRCLDLLTDLSKESEMPSQQSLKLQLHLPRMITNPEEGEVAVVLGVAGAEEMVVGSDKHPLQPPVRSRWGVLKPVRYPSNTPSPYLTF